MDPRKGVAEEDLAFCRDVAKSVPIVCCIYGAAAAAVFYEACVAPKAARECINFAVLPIARLWLDFSEIFLFVYAVVRPTLEVVGLTSLLLLTAAFAIVYL